MRPDKIKGSRFPLFAWLIRRFAGDHLRRTVNCEFTDRSIIAQPRKGAINLVDFVHELLRSRRH
jgi:hypothetical protein